MGGGWGDPKIVLSEYTYNCFQFKFINKMGLRISTPKTYKCYKNDQNQTH